MMFRRWVLLLCLFWLPLELVAAPEALVVKVTDARTGNPVEDVRVIVNGGPAADPTRAEMEQKNRQFQPHTLMVTKGSEVNFPNRDTTQHHVYSFSPAKSFNLELFADQPDVPVVFDKTGVVEVGCNIHDQMQGFILVTDSSLTARTDSSGMARLSLPDSEKDTADLSLSLWHPRLKNVTQTVDFSISSSTAEPLKLALDLTPEQAEAGPLDGLQKRFQDL